MVILIGSLLAVLGVIFLLCCCCYKRRLSIEKKGDVEESERRNKVVSSISPPYYSSHDNKGLIGSDLSDPSKMSSLPIYATAAGSLNGHVAQNYYLTEGNDPSPGASNETAQSDLWMMKSEISEGQNDMQMPYHYNNGQLEPQGYSYSYYPHEEYQHLDESNNMSLKNALYSPFYDENPIVYGTTVQPNGFLDQMTDQGMVVEPNGLSSPPGLQQYGGEEEDEQQYGSHRSGRVIREIIV